LTYYFRSAAARERLIAGSGKVAITNISQYILSQMVVPMPSLAEQKKIVAILSTVQLAIEQQERLIELTTELKKALMQKLFTEGTSGEPQNKTEIGLVPESWETSALGDVCTVQTGIAKGRKIDPNDAVTLPYLRVANVQDGYLDLKEMKEITLKKNEIEYYCPL
jgi:type I restriction enzyme S subunit